MSLTSDPAPQARSPLRRILPYSTAALCLGAVFSISIDYREYQAPFLVDFRGATPVVLILLWIINWSVRLPRPSDQRREQRETARKVWMQTSLEFAALVAAIVLASTEQFARWRFLLSAPALEEYAQRLRSQFKFPIHEKSGWVVSTVQEPDGGRRVGLYWVRRTEIYHDGGVCFDVSGFGRHGFAYLPQAASKLFAIDQQDTEHIAGPWWRWQRAVRFGFF
jgi:hypothetical protein